MAALGLVYFIPCAIVMIHRRTTLDQVSVCSPAFGPELVEVLVMCGRFNIHLDNPTDHLTSQFLSFLFSFNPSLHVNFPTHNKNHIPNLVITSSHSSHAPSLSFHDTAVAALAFEDSGGQWGGKQGMWGGLQVRAVAMHISWRV